MDKGEMMEIGSENKFQNHQAFLNQFISACQTDERVVAAFLGGSYASGKEDRYSDLDLYIIVSEDAYEDFCSNRNKFLSMLGEPVFAENFDIPDIVFFIFADGTEGELGIGRVSNFAHIHSGPFLPLVDKKGVLAGVEFSYVAADPMDQAEKLRRLLYWFWHDLSHFISAMGRDQLWWAQGQLEELRRICINLARLKSNPADPDIGTEPYFKLDEMIQVDQLSVLKDTIVPLEKSAMIQAGVIIVCVYKELALSLAEALDLPYLEALERIMVHRLEDLHSTIIL